MLVYHPLRQNDFLACLFVGIREKLAKKAALPLFICCESANIYKSEIETDIVIYRMADKKPDNFDTDGNIALEERTKTKKPSLYRVLMLNDDYTPMEFVVMVLQRYFGHNHESAQRIMLHVHQRGVGVCGVFTYEIAETKAAQVMNFARQNEHPLQLQLEKE